MLFVMSTDGVAVLIQPRRGRRLGDPPRSGYAVLHVYGRMGGLTPFLPLQGRGTAEAVDE